MNERTNASGSQVPGGAGQPPKSPRQSRMGPAPFASFEDVSDEQDSPDEKPVIRLPDIREDISGSTTTINTSIQGGQSNLLPAVAMENLAPGNITGTVNLQTPSTPRIDISRASSSSHHDSRDSSPENAIFGVSESEKDREGAKLGLGFREDGTADLRSSTEELAFLEPNTVTAEKETSKQPSRKSPLMFKQEDHHRKDSQCSDIVLLSISGRTSRLSSIGSQGSGHSNASGHSNMSHISGVSNVSHISGQSRLSVISGISRSPSPHKMLLETSFCGPKPLENEVGVVANDKHRNEVLEEVLLSRKHDPREAIVAESVKVVTVKAKEPVVKPPIVAEIPPRVVEKTRTPTPAQQKSAAIRRQSQEQLRKESLTSPVITLSTLGSSYKPEKKTESQLQVKNNVPTTRTKQQNRKNSAGGKQPSKPGRSGGGSETDFIRIKLKPDHMYDEDSEQSKEAQQDALQKPVSLNLNDHSKKSAQHFSQLVKREDSLNKISRHPGDGSDSQKSSISSKSKSQSPNATPTASPRSGRRIHLKDKEHGSRTPSPAGVTTSRKSSFCSLFKSRETIASPESPTGSVSKKKGLTGLIKDASGSIHSSRSRSKSRDRSGTATPTSGGKPKGSVLAIFKPRKSSASASPVARESLPNLDGLNTMEYKYSSEAKSVQNLRSTAKERLKYYDTPVDGVIRIPLHTPSDEEEKILNKEKLMGKSTLQEDLNQIKIDRPVSAPSSSRPSISQPSSNITENPQNKKRDPNSKQTVLPDGSIRIPLHSPSEDRYVRCDLLSPKEAQELNRQCSKISIKKGSKIERVSNGSVSSSSDISKHEEKVVIERRTEVKKPVEKNVVVEKPVVIEKIVPVEQVKTFEQPKAVTKTKSIERMKQVEDVKPFDLPPKCVEQYRMAEPMESTPEPESEPEPFVEEEKISSQSKKHIIFTTKVGSKDQLFSLQFSLSKTDSQSSQMSENRSQISEDSVIEMPIGDKRIEDAFSNRSPSVDSRTDVPSKKSEEVAKFSTDEFCIHSSEMTDSKHSEISLISSEKSFKDSPQTTYRNSAISESVSPRNSVDDPVHDSSESERDSELDFVRKKQLQALEKAGVPEPEVVDHERKGLVLQQDSFDDELPYVPTTLPQERSVAVPIVPVKQRQGYEMKTFPIERPRSTTPINPSCLEEYCSDEVYTPDATKAERLKISLPKEEAPEKTKAKQKTKSPRRISTASSPKTWFEFAEQGIANVGARKSSTGHESDSDPAPPLPPRAPVNKPQWINFEDIPERRKLPKRIQTIPSRTTVEVSNETNVVYTYVNPEDCKCECHEAGKEHGGDDVTPDKEEDEEPLLDENEEAEGISVPVSSRLRGESTREKRCSSISDSSQESSYGHSDCKVSTKKVGAPFNADLDLGSNRSSIISQEGDRRSSSSGSPNEGPLPPRRPPRPP